jgi:DNA-binding CsgD family transcriptional regulator
MGGATSGLARLVDLADTMTWSDQPDEALADGLVAARRATGADLAPFYLLDDRIESLRLVAEPDERRLLAGYEELPASAYARMPQLIRTLRPIVIGDLAHPEPEDFLPDEVGAGIAQRLRTGAVVPLVAGGRLLGVICLSFESRRPSSPEQVDFLAVVGRIIGAAIHHAQVAARLRELATLQESARISHVLRQGALADVTDVESRLAVARTRLGLCDPAELDAELGSIGDVAATVRAELYAQMVQLRSAAGAVEVRVASDSAGPTGLWVDNPLAWAAGEAARRDVAGQPDPDRQRRLAALTPREGQIMALVVDGLSNTQIGHVLHLSPETVKKDLGRIMDKLQVHNRVQATARMLREGLAH